MFESGLEEFKQFITYIYLGIGALVSVFVVHFLSFYYNHGFVRPQKNLLSEGPVKSKEVLGLEEMQQGMLSLSMLQKNVKWAKYHFLIKYRNKVLYNNLNRIRTKLSGVNEEVIALIPASRQASIIPVTNGASGPTITISIALF